MSARPVVALAAVQNLAGANPGEYLTRRGYDVREVQEEWAAESVLSVPGIDVAVIGAGFSAELALDLLRRHGAKGGPFFIFLFRSTDLLDRVLALELGAADVVPLSISVRELAARIAGLLGRRGKAAPDLIMLENATVDLRSALVMHRSGGEEQLSPGQVALIRLFIASPHKVLTRDDIMAAAPAESTDAFDRSIDSRIVRLRRKLDTESITTIRGTGYRFDPPSAETD